MSSRVTDVITTCLRPSRTTASATRAGSSICTTSVLPLGTEQKPQGRVQTFPRIMNVAVRCDQHSVRFGHFALSQTVSSRKSSMTLLVKYMPGAGSGRFSQGGRRRLGAGGTSCRISSVDIGHPPRANEQRVSGENLVLRISQAIGQVADQALANGRHGNRPAPQSLQRRRSQVATEGNETLQVQQRMHVDEQSLVSDPPFDGRPNEGKGTAATRHDAGIPLERRSRDPQLSTQIEDAADERGPIVA